MKRKLELVFGAKFPSLQKIFAVPDFHWECGLFKGFKKE